MSFTGEAAKRLELQNNVHMADDLIRLAVGVARRYDAVNQKPNQDQPVIKLDLDEVKALAEQKYGNS